MSTLAWEPFGFVGTMPVMIFSSPRSSLPLILTLIAALSACSNADTAGGGGEPVVADGASNPGSATSADAQQDTESPPGATGRAGEGTALVSEPLQLLDVTSCLSKRPPTRAS